jgi:rhodanese-related sulfurtransferase
MIELLKRILGLGPKVNYKELIANGAKIVDVRTPNEYKSGNIKGSINLPLQTLSSNLGKLKKDEVIITCCASGMRSSSARSLLKSNGFTNVYNGGSWINLR